MKGRITTVITLTGVLVAGSAAALVNTQVLQSTESNSSGEVTVGSTDNSNTATTAVATTDGTITKIQSNVLSATQAMYQVGDAGLVTLDTAGDVLTVVSVTPNSGWTVVNAESSGSADIEVKLQNGSTVVEFKANLQLGVITTSVESKIVGSDNSNGTTPGGGTVKVGVHHDSDDGDDHDDDDADDHDSDDDGVSVTIELEGEHDDD